MCFRVSSQSQGLGRPEEQLGDIIQQLLAASFCLVCMMPAEAVRSHFLYRKSLKGVERQHVYCPWDKCALFLPSIPVHAVLANALVWHFLRPAPQTALSEEDRAPLLEMGFLWSPEILASLFLKIERVQCKGQERWGSLSCRQTVGLWDWWCS